MSGKVHSKEMNRQTECYVTHCLNHKTKKLLGSNIDCNSSFLLRGLLAFVPRIDSGLVPRNTKRLADAVNKL